MFKTDIEGHYFKSVPAVHRFYLASSARMTVRQNLCGSVSYLLNNPKCSCTFLSNFDKASLMSRHFFG